MFDHSSDSDSGPLVVLINAKDKENVKPYGVKLFLLTSKLTQILNLIKLEILME